MAFTTSELTQIAKDKINADRLEWTAQNDISYYRGLHHKYDYQLKNLIDLYESKYPRIIELYKNLLDDIEKNITNFSISVSELKGEFERMKNKVLRIADKYWAVRWEIKGRELEIFKRKPVGTTYYIDLDGGNDGNTGLNTGQAWLTVEKYTTTTVRSASDIAYVRANTDEVISADIAVDEDGDEDNWIKIIGCDSVVNDPWGDGSDVKPAIDANSGSHTFRINNDDFWWLERLELKNGADGTAGILQIRQGITFVKDSKFTDNSLAIKLLFCYDLTVLDGCEIVSSSSSGTGVAFAYGSNCEFRSCTIDGHDIGILVGDYANDELRMIDCEIGQTTPPNSYDIRVDCGRVYLRNTKLSASGINMATNNPAWLMEEDADGVYGDAKIWFTGGNITKQSSPKTGNAEFSLKLDPNSYLGINRYLRLSPIYGLQFPFVIEGTAAQQVTITIKMQAEVAWASYPTNTELYIEASYYDSGVDAGRSTVASTQTISSSGSWVDFTVTLTPQRDGPIYVDVYLKVYESGKSITVNGEATTS